MTSRSNASNLYLRGDIAFDRDHPISDGGFGELFAGSHPSDGKVALKRLRIRGTGDERQQYLVDTMAEAEVWRALVHPSVLPFLGILFEGRDIYLVSPLVENGSLPRYLSGHPAADRGALLREVAEGLAFLHSQRVVHGDVKGGNILVLSGPKAALCDFGLAKILNPSTTTTVGGLGTIRWESPELMEGGARSYEADVYAYGMTVYEVLSGRIPFHTIQKETAVIIAVLNRDERPLMGNTPADPHAIFRDVAQRCWARLPNIRPSMMEVVQSLTPPATYDHEESTQALSLTSGAEGNPDLFSGTDGDSQEQGSNQRALLSMEVVKLEGHSVVYSVAFSPDGSRLASGSLDRTVRLWDVSSGTMELALKNHTDWVLCVAFSPDGSQVASGSHDKTVRLWNAISGAELGTLRGHTDFVRDIIFSPDGLRVASGSDDKTARLWATTSRAELATLRGHTSNIMSVAFSPVGSKLASGSADTTIQLWDAASGAKLITLQGHTEFVCGVAFSSDGMRLVSGSDDRTVRIWDTSSGKEVMKLGGHTDRVKSVAISPDGGRVASGSDDKTVRLWDMTSGTETATLKGHTDRVRSVAFSPVGSLLASASWDKTIRLWRYA